MLRDHISMFATQPGAFDELHCRVCGTRCDVYRDQYGPIGFMTASCPHDRFTCPHNDAPWHEQARELLLQIADTPSKRLAALLRQDVQDILQEHGFTLPEDG